MSIPVASIAYLIGGSLVGAAAKAIQGRALRKATPAAAKLPALKGPTPKPAEVPAAPGRPTAMSTNAPIVSAVSNITGEVGQYAPLALSAVTAIEGAASGLPGETKSQIAVNVVMAAAQTGEQITALPAVSAISSLVAMLVAILNASGVFQHKAKTVAAPVAPAAPAATEPAAV